MITFIDEKGTEHSALVAYSVTNAVNGELSVKGTIYTNDKVLHGIDRGWRFRLDDEYYRVTYAKPNDAGQQIEVEFDAVHQFFYDMSKSMVYDTLNGSKPFETYLQAIFSGSGYTYSLETTVGSIRKENFGNKSRLSLFNDIIKAAGLEFSVRGHVVRILKRIGTDLSTIVRKDFNMNELKIEKDINSFVTYQRGLGAWKDDEDHSKGRYESEYESPLAKIYGRIEAEPVVDERYKETGKLLERLKENVDKSYKVSIEIDMEDLSRAGYRISRPNPGDYIMAINENLGFRQKVRIVSFTSEYDVGGNLISRKVICNDIGTVQRATSEISHLSRTLTDSIEGSERALQTATRALVSADGKNTNYFGDVKPLDVPKGTLRKGDRLFLTVGDKKQLYFWNGAEWELEPTEFDHEKFDMEFNRKSQEIKKAIQENRQKAEEALRNSGASSLLAQEAKRIGLDSIARLEEFKRQATSAQTALSGDLDTLKRTIANDIRPKQAQAEAEIAKQVKALGQTRDELLGIKSAQATYEETTTRRLSELTNLANGKASKSELTQTAEELKSRIASAHLGRRNLLKGTKELARYKPASEYNGFKVIKTTAEATGYRDSYTERTVVSMTGTEYIAIFYARASENDYPMRCHLYNPNTVTLSANSSGYTSKSSDGLSIVRLSTDWQLCWVKWTQTATDQAKTVIIGRHGPQVGGKEGAWIEICAPALFEGNLVGDWSPAYEDQDERVTAVESTFKQRADSLEAGVNRLTEGLRTKVDISSLNVTAENIRQSVKSLETSTKDKLDQKLSLAEFEVRAGSIRQEILNATKDKADKTLVTAEAGKLREELSSLSVGGVNLLKKTKTFNGVNGQSQLLSETYKNCVVRYFKNADANSAYQDIVEYSNALYPELGGTYTLSFWAKGAGEMTTFFYGRRGFLPVSSGTTSQGLVSKAGDGNCRFTLSADWQRYYVVYKLAETPAEATSIYKHVLFRHNSRSTTDEIWLAGVKLERGNLATDYSENPEDVENLITEAKATFERTALGLRTDLSAIQAYVNKDGQRQEALQRYTREESARQATAVRELVTRDYVGKATYQEDVRGIERKFEAITNPQNGSIATQIATYKTAVDGRLTEITSLISGKANQADFQRVKETSQLYERILGNTNNSIADNIARMALTNQLFQVEVSKNENLKTVQRQLAGSWGVHNKNSVNEIIAGFNLAGRNAGIKAETIRLEGRTLLDELTAIQGYFKRLFVGDASVGTLNSDIIRSNSITADKLVMDIAMARRFVSSDIFTDTLAAKEAFINKLRSVVVTATLLEGYKGRIGGFQIGTHEKDSSVYWITGQNQFSVGMSNGSGQWSQTALWVNWGNNWGYPGDYAWYVKNNGKMYCYNTAEFWNTPVIHGNLRVTGHIYYNNENSGKTGHWIHSSKYSNFEPSDNYLYLYYSGSGYDWISMNKEISDRRYKHNIEDSTVSGLDVIERLKTYRYRKEYDGKIEDISCGIMAQDVQKYAPEAFFENPDGAYSYNTFALVPYLIKAIQELNHKIEKLEKTA